MTKLTRWILINFSILFAFIYANEYSNTILLYITLSLLWFTAIIGMLILLIPKSFIQQINVTPSISRNLDLTYDIILTLFIVNYHFYYLAIFYIIQIYSVDRYYKIKLNQ